MRMIKRKKLMSKVRIVFLFVVVLGDWSWSIPAKARWSKAVRHGPAPLVPGLASGPARALAAARWAPAPALPPGAPPGLLASGPVRALAAARWASAPALPPGVPPGLPWLPQEVISAEVADP